MSITDSLPLTPDEDRRILRKIDLFLLPQLMIVHFLSLLDKVILSHAAILGIRKDLHLQGQDYAWASGIFYFGYLAFCYPAAVLLVKLPIGKFLAFSTIIWAVITLSTVSLHDAGGLQTTRFFLGVAEAANVPAAIVIVAMFYKVEEQPSRLGVWMLGSLVATVVGNIIPVGVANIHNMAPWKVLYLIYGSATLVWGVALWFLMPNTPMTCWFLDKEDRAKAVLRVELNRTGIKNNEWKKSQFLEALAEPAAWLLVLFQLSFNIAGSGVTAFASIIIQGLGFSTIDTFLVQLIPIAVQAVCIVVAVVLCHYFKNTRAIWCSGSFVTTIIGIVMIRQLPHEQIWARFAGFCFANTSVIIGPLLYSIASANFGGFTKKSTANAMIMIGYSTGAIIGPQLFFESESPSFPTGFLAVMVCLSVCCVVCIAMNIYLSRENRRREKLCQAAPISPSVEDASVPAELMDKTDREILEFRYVY